MELHKFYDKAYSWILNVGPRLIVAIIFFILAQWLVKLIRRWMEKALLKRDMHSSLVPFFVSFTSAVLQILIALAILQILSLQLTVFTAIVGGISVAAGLALSGTLQNFTSGILILLLKPFRVGDYILAQNQEGLVKSIQIFYTVVTTNDNKTVIVPNSKLSNEVIVNLSLEGSRRLDIIWKVGFGLDLEKMKDIINTTLKKFPGVLSDPAPDITVSEIDPDGYKLALYVWINANDYYNTKVDLQEELVHNLKQSQIKLTG